MIVIALLAGVFVLGFAAGFATRSQISRKRRVQYLRHSPYLPK